MNVTVIHIPGRTTTVEVNNEGATVRDVLKSISAELGQGEAVRVNANTADLDTPVNDNDRVIVSRGAKGNS